LVIGSHLKVMKLRNLKSMKLKWLIS